jgi:uncharacterized membrane protein YhhN
VSKAQLPWFLVGVGLYFVSMAAGSFELGIVVKALPVLVLAFGVWGVEWFRRLVGMGLLLGAAGDVILEAGYFLPGLIVFLLGHVLYIGAFLQKSREMAVSWLLPAVVYVGALLVLCVPKAGPFAVPVVAYGLVIGSMAWRAGAWGSGWAIVGAYVFAFSDSIIAINKFVTPVMGAAPVIMLTYWLGQFLIASSVVQDREQVQEQD